MEAIRPGILRIEIKGPESQKYDKRSERVGPAYDLVHEIYRQVWPLLPGDRTIHVPIESHMAMLDKDHGIDLILTTTQNTQISIQEKILTWKETTATFENIKTSGKLGAHYYCIAQYYMVAYYRNGIIDKWVILNVAKLRELELSNQIKYNERRNKKDGIETSFYYIHFNDIPESCIFAKSWNDGEIDMDEDDYPF